MNYAKEAVRFMDFVMYDLPPGPKFLYLHQVINL